ncbi:hypothetical protein BDZ91DRAFT_791937 [Kalaharituber pfeilii]|nr:hypothetical protein BDZ91DRAFT_791937 [Kalaharituber pfeilii]
MKFTTAFLTLAFSAIVVSALVIPAAEVNARDIQAADSALAKRGAAPTPAAAPEPPAPSVGPVKDDDEDVPEVPEDDSDAVKLADSEEEEFLRSIANLPEEDGDDDDTGLDRRDYIERRGIIDKIIKILLKKISKTSLGKKVWNAVGGGLRKSIVKYLKSKAKTLSKITKADRNWLKNKIKGALKKVLKSIIGGWAAGKVLEIVVDVQPAYASLYKSQTIFLKMKGGIGMQTTI